MSSLRAAADIPSFVGLQQPEDGWRREQPILAHVTPMTIRKRGRDLRSIEACIANDRRADNGSPDLPAWSLDRPRIEIADINRKTTQTPRHLRTDCRPVRIPGPRPRHRASRCLSDSSRPPDSNKSSISARPFKNGRIEGVSGFGVHCLERIRTAVVAGLVHRTRGKSAAKHGVRDACNESRRVVTTLHAIREDRLK